MRQPLRNRILSALMAVVMVISMLPVSAFAADTADHVVINEAYGGGGNTGAEYKNDFVELYNPTSEDVSLAGWSIQYASATGSFGSNIFTFADNAVIEAKGFYLVQMAAGSGGTKDLPNPDAEGSISMGAKNFKLALVNGTEAISGAADAAVVDFLGAGTAGEFEGSAAAPAGSNTKSLARGTDGVDTDDNGADFAAGAPTPQGSAGAAAPETSEPETSASETSTPETSEPETSEPETSEPEVSVPEVVLPEAKAIADGTYVIWEAVNGKAVDALAESYSYGYLNPTDVTLTDGVLSGYGETNLFTVRNVADGQFTIQDSYGRYLYMKGTYNSFNVSASEPASGHLWLAVDAGDGNVSIMNVEMSKYLAYDLQYKSFGAYTDISETRISVLTLTEGKIAENPDPTVPSVPDETEPDSTEPETPAGAGKVTAAADFTSGTYVMVVNTGYAPAVLSSGWLTAVQPVIAEDKVTDDQGAVWTLTVTDGTVTITDANGVTIAPKGGNNNGIREADYQWAWSFDEATQTFTFAGQGEDTVLLASNVGSENKFRGYKNATVSGNPEGYPSQFTLYQVAAAENPDPTDPTKPSEPDTTEPVVTAPIANGDKVVIYAPAYGMALSSVKTGNYNVGVAVTLTEGVMTGYADTEVWTVVDNGDGTFSFQQDGQNIGLADSYASMNLGTVHDKWELTDLGEGLYNIKNTGRGNYMEWYAQYSNWSTYNSSSAATDGQFQLSFYKVTGETPDPGPEYNTISEALAATEGTFTVKGVVTLVDGKNLYLQDATGAICLRLSENQSADMLGKTLIGTGSKTVYNGLPQLGSGSYELSSGLILEAKKTTISALTDADIAAYVKLSGMEITEVYDNNGAYSNPNITVKDASGNEIQLYKAVIGKNEDGTWAWAVGDKIDITAAVGVYNGKYQLRNTVASEVAAYVEKLLADGDRVVIYNPANNKALSTTYAGYYNNGTDISVANGVVSGFTAADVWTVGENADGTFTFSTTDGKKLSMGASFSSTPLDDVNTAWNVVDAATEGCYYIQNAARGSYLEWYADKNNWSSYYSIGNNEALFAQAFYKVTGDITEGGTVEEGSQVMLYNLSAKGVLAAEGDNQVITNALATIAEGKATASNGGVIFTVQKNGEYYRFYNETYGYLCSNGTGNNAFYSLEATEDADWTLAVQGSGYTLESRTAKFNGKYSQYLEYYSDSYKTYSMYNVTDYDIYTFQFYPCANEMVTGGIVNEPAVDFGTLLEAFIHQPYTFSFTVDAVFGLEGELTVQVGETVLTANEDGTYTVPGELVVGESFTITVTGVDTKGVALNSTAIVTVLDEPTISDVTPASGAETGDNKKPEISAVIGNAGENPEVTMTVGGEKVEAVYADGKISYTAAEDMADGRVTVTVTVTRTDGKTASKSWNFTVGKAKDRLYFGQLHSHTTYSDGSGSLESALDYIKNLPDSANVDFVAFTDHSNYFDKSGAANPEGALYDMTLATSYSQETWASYKNAVAEFNASQSDVIALAGFEMTWSGGPGHMNTFNTEGIVSRNNTTLNNKTADAGMKAYYALLSQAEGVNGISQFNHPGSTFGTFSDFSYWDALIDTRIQLVEVGNGEGQVGAGGYYPSYEYYTMALDKGWHLAPTNNQDNHKGKWGNANDARDVILTDNFTEEGIYQAIREMRMYATEDKNLEIYYTVNGLKLGSSITEVPEKLDLSVLVNDPDATDSISKVEVIVNSGKVAHTWNDPAELASGDLSVTLDPTYSYYYIRVTQGDGDLAVTAPVWVGESLKLGISSVECGTSTPVTGEELKLTTTLFNSEITPATIKALTYQIKGGEVIGTDTTGYELPASGTAIVDFAWTPSTAKVTTITVTAIVEQEGVDYTFTMDITLDVQDADKLVYIGIDASHYNEYVNGNYKDSMGNFGQLAAGYSVRTVDLKTSEDLIAACDNDKYKAIILTAPSRRSSEAQNHVPLKVYTAEELEAIKAFNENGGTVILAGWSDHYENYPSVASIKNMKPEEHMAATQNAVLEALGSSLRIADDATYDDDHNGGQAYRLYFNTYGDSFLTSNVEVDPEHPHDRMYTEVFSHYGGASVYTVDGTLPETVSPVVFGHSGTYSVDVDADGLGGADMYKYTCASGDDRLMIMATEQLPGQGLIVVSGAAFMSNFEVQATIEDSGAEKNYANYKICENLVQYLNPVQITDIAEVQAETEEGVKFTIEGIVTSNASGYDKDTAFFDCIYLQDETAGINAFPVAGNFKIGDKVRITGTTSSYQGERQIAVSTIEKIGEGTVEPKAVTAAEINDRSVLGSLITLKGTVTSFELANGLVQTILVKDEHGDEARVFIDGYITTAKEVENLKVGCAISVTGLASYDESFAGVAPRIRIRNRADVVCGEIEALTAPVVRVANKESSGDPVLTWEAVAAAEEYKIYRRMGKTGSFKLVKTTADTTYTDTSAEATRAYYYYVVAVNAEGSEKSNTVVRAADLARPVVRLSSVASTGKIKISWNAVEDAVSYKVYRSETREGGYTLVKTTKDTSIVDTTAKAGMTYYYKVKAMSVASNAHSAYSVVKYRTCDLAKPVIALANVASTGKIKISWEAIEGAVAYQVYVSTRRSGDFQLMAETTATSAVHTEGAAGETYYYKVCAVAEKAAANSAFSTTKYRTCDLARPVLKLSNIASTGKIRLEWNAVEGAQSYQVYYATSRTGEYKLLKETTGTTLKHTSAKAEKTYFYIVVAVAENEYANSAFSGAKSRTCDLARPVVTVKLNSKGDPRLTWKEIDGAEKYRVERSTDGENWTTMMTTTKTSYTNTSAEEGTTYYYRVTAISRYSSANSARSAEKSITAE